MWIIIAAAVGFILGLIVGIIWTNIAISNRIGRHLGW
jgi:hypothetical protein